MIEVLAAADLQFVYIDGEHGRFDWRDIEAACIAAERHGLTPIARIPDISSATITRFLDRGVRGHRRAAHRIGRRGAARGRCRVFRAARQPLVRRGPPGIWPAHRQPAGAHGGVQCARLGVPDDRKPARASTSPDELAALPGVDYLSFGMLDLAQSLGHPGDSDASRREGGGRRDASSASARAGKRVREDFMNYAWINDVLIAGARQLLDAAPLESRKGVPARHSIAATGASADD